MGDETTPVSGGSATATEAEDIEAIVSGLPLFGEGEAKDTPTPATSTSTEGTGKGASDKPKKDDPPAAPKTEQTFLTEEALGKLTLKEISNPSFDWSKVPASWQKVLKGWQGDATRAAQAISELRKQAAPKQKPPQPAEPPKEDDVDAQNRSIVAGALKELGIDPDVAADAIEDVVLNKGIALAAQAVPQYVSDETFHNAVNEAIVTDEQLTAHAESKDPKRIAFAIRTAADRVQVKQLSEKTATFDQRTKDLEARENALKEKEAELERERTKLNRNSPTISGGKPRGSAPPSKTGEKTIEQIADELNLPDRLRVG
jgi:hypothetical protein